jgi:hypothetical protein
MEQLVVILSSVCSSTLCSLSISSVTFAVSCLLLSLFSSISCLRFLLFTVSFVYPLLLLWPVLFFWCPSPSYPSLLLLSLLLFWCVSLQIKCIYIALRTSADISKCCTETQPKTPNSKQRRC